MYPKSSGISNHLANIKLTINWTTIVPILSMAAQIVPDTTCFPNPVINENFYAPINY